MAVDTATMGHELQFGLGATGAALPVTQRLALDQCGVKKIPTLIAPDNEMNGTLSRRSEPVTTGPSTVGGPIAWAPRPDELTTVLPLIFGGTFAGQVLEPDHINDGFPFSFDRKTGVYNYAGMKFASASFSSAPGQLLQLQAQLEGKTEALAAAGSFPTLALSTLQPYTHHQAVITIDGVVRKVGAIQISVENNLILDRTENTSSRTELPQTGRVMRFTCDARWDVTDDDLNLISVAGVAGSVVYTNGAYSLTFEFPKLKIAPETPEGSKTAEMRQQVQFECYAELGNGTSDHEVKITHDATP